MALQKANINWSSKQISSMVKNGKINFEHIAQRGLTWERARKANLIESIVLSYPIPQVFAKRVVSNEDKKGNNIYFILDGKQRLSTIKEFLNDEFALTKLDPVEYFDEELNKEVTLDISNKKFSQLPEGLQDIINTTTFNIVYFDNLSKEEEMTLFRKLNNGKPLSAKSRTLASAKNIEELLDIGSHKLFKEMLSEKARQDKNQAVISVKAWIMLNREIGNISFSSKDLNPFIKDIKMTDTQKLVLNDVFDYIVSVHSELIARHEKDVAKKLYKETHMISLIPFVKRAIENNIDEAMFSEFLIDFFKIENNSDEYTKYIEASSHGIARNSNIIARHEALEESYKNYFKAE